MQSNTVVFAKRSLSLSKTQAVIGLLFAAIGLFTIVSLTLSAKHLGIGPYFLLSVSFLTFGNLMFPMPVILLYVYDKNNGVLEHLLSIGWDQNDIFKQYLKAALFLSSIVLVAESVAVLIACAIAGSPAVLLLDLFDVVAHRVPRSLCGLLYHHGDDGFQFITEATNRRQRPSRHGSWCCVHISNFLSRFSGIYVGVLRRAVDRHFGRGPVRCIADPVKQADQKGKNASMMLDGRSSVVWPTCLWIDNSR